MNIHQKYDKIIDLQKKLTLSETMHSFLENNKEDLSDILSSVSLGSSKQTKKSLYDLLQQQQNILSWSSQKKHLHHGLQEGKILPLTSALERKRKEEVAKINYLPMILQLACSHPDQYFRKNFESTTKHNELIDYVVIDPSMVPQGFLDAFQIESIDIDAQNIKEIFKKAQPLVYHKEKSVKTWRVVFVEGKLIVFRELHQLLHKQENLTQGEKRRIEYKKYFNTFDDIYSALRSQQYVVDKEESKIDDYKDVQKQMIELLQDIKFATKHGEEKRKLDEIIADIQGATSFYIMASKFYNLFKIDFFNKSIAANHVLGSGNKLSKELHRLRSIILEIQLQSDALQQLLETQEYTFQTFSLHLSKAVSERNFDLLYTTLHQYYKQSDALSQKTQPFVALDTQIHTLFGASPDISSLHSNKALFKAEILIFLQNIYLHIYQLEHKIKMGTAQSSDFVFDMSICKKYPELDQSLFSTISHYTNQLEDFGSKILGEDEKDACISLLQQLKNLSDWEENIQLLKQL